MKNLTHKDYTTQMPAYQLVLPLNVEILIPKDDSVRFLSQVMEDLDYTDLYKAYSPKGRKSAISPKNLFKIIVYGYMNNIYTSRALEQSCLRDINFMWLLEGEKAPDHNAIARFRSKRIATTVEDLFYQLVQLLKDQNEICFENIFIDETKIEANANKYSFVWKKSTLKHHQKLDLKIITAIEEINKEFQLEYSTVTPLQEILDFLNKQKEHENIIFVFGSGKRKSILQKTDHDATFMRMKEDHMKNGQLKPGYNVQIGVEAEYIVGVDISPERADSLTLIPFLGKMEKHLNGEKYANIIADAGYESEENYTYLEKNEQVCYIKPTNYERSKLKKHRNNLYARENMKYDEELDEYSCPNNKKLKPIGAKVRKSKSGYKSNITVYECENCIDCQYKTSCTKAQGNRRLEVSKRFQVQRNDSLKNITSDHGILLRMNRSIQVEGAFGVIKEDHKFRQFLLRGKKKVMIEFLLIAIGYNINKLHNKIQDNRHGMQLHEKEIA